MPERPERSERPQAATSRELREVRLERSGRPLKGLDSASRPCRWAKVVTGERSVTWQLDRSRYQRPARPSTGTRLVTGFEERSRTPRRVRLFRLAGSVEIWLPCRKREPRAVRLVTADMLV